MRKALHALCERDRWPVTFSIGVTTFYPPVPSADAAVAAADMVMYRAKAAGKDRVVFARFPDVSTPGAASVSREHARAD